jgi:hypothetical protein
MRQTQPDASIEAKRGTTASRLALCASVFSFGATAALVGLGASEILPKGFSAAQFDLKAWIFLTVAAAALTVGPFLSVRTFLCASAPGRALQRVAAGEPRFMTTGLSTTDIEALASLAHAAGQAGIFRTMVEAAPIALMLVEAETRALLTVNRAARTWLTQAGFRTGPDDHIDTDRLFPTSAAWEQALQVDDAKPFEGWLSLAGRPVEIRIVPAYDSWGRHAGAMLAWMPDGGEAAVQVGPQTAQTQSGKEPDRRSLAPVSNRT